MKRIDTSASLFGLDLAQLQRDWALALSRMTQWPFLRWLAPVYVTRVHSANGEFADYVESEGGASQSTRVAKTARFAGVMLPDEIVLWHAMTLPKLKADAIALAIELQVKNLSPFATQDVVWASSSANSSRGEGATHVAITSRNLIARHLAGLQSDFASKANKLEVWVRAPSTSAPLVLAGFGETWRRRLTARWRIVNLLLVLLLLLVIAAAAITPTVQLKLRSTQAAQSYTALQASAAPALQQREQLLKLEQHAKALQEQIEQSLQPELVLRQITKLLPDDTYLSSLQMQGAKVVLTGQAPNTAALMQQLGAQPGIKDVKAPTAAVKPRGSERETFNIEFTLDPSSLVAKP